MKKSFGFVKKNLYLGLAFLVVVVLLWFFIFSGMREGFYADVDTSKTRNFTASNDKKTSDKAARDAESSSS